jgi:quercetin dioxygenase-like cupin family protein
VKERRLSFAAGVEHMEHDAGAMKSRDLSSQPARLSELIECQEGSVVSRTLIDKKTGTVTLFAFDQGQGLSEHKTPFDALVHIFDGEAEVTVSGKAHRMTEGQMIIMPANKPHALRAVKKFRMILTMIKS